MSILSDTKKNFGKTPIPDPLLKLIEFASKCPTRFSDGFEFGQFDEKDMLRTYSEDDAFLSSIVEFAMADGTGSIYALWVGATPDVEKAPVLVFGSEGGVHPVASSTLELLELLTFDSEPMVEWKEVVFYKDKDSRTSKSHAEYVAWLEKQFKIKPIDNAESIVSKAQAAYGERFKTWMKKYYDN